MGGIFKFHYKLYLTSLNLLLKVAVARIKDNFVSKWIIQLKTFVIIINNLEWKINEKDIVYPKL